MPQGGSKTGVKAGLDQGGPGDLPSAPAVQEDLFLPATLSEGQKARHTRAAAAEKRGRGRPPGAPNRRSKEWQAYLFARYSSPLEGLMATGDMSPRELLVAMEICAPGEKPSPKQLIWAAEYIKDAQKAALPFLHERRGAVVEGEDGEDVAVLAIGWIARPGGGRPGDGAKRIGGSVIDARPADVRREENQGVGGEAGEKSTAPQSTQKANSLKAHDNQGE